MITDRCVPAYGAPEEAMPDTRHCVADRQCRRYDHAAGHPAWTTSSPLCPDCLTTAARDTSMLIYDYIDLEQALPRSVVNQPDGQPGHHVDAPIPLRLDVEALQQEIVHVATTWAGELRAHLHLTDPPTRGIRAGRQLQQALTVLTPHLERLARLAPVAAYATGCDDPPADIPGWQAVLHLAWLHQRARSMLGRTRRTTQVPGRCSHCGHGLFRDEPRYERDPCPVYCGACDTRWTYDQYERYVGLLLAHPSDLIGDHQATM